MVGVVGFPVVGKAVRIRKIERGGVNMAEQNCAPVKYGYCDDFTRGWVAGTAG